MFEAKLTEGVILKKIVDSIKDIVTDVNIDISPSGKWQTVKNKKMKMKLNKLFVVKMKSLLRKTVLFLTGRLGLISFESASS